MSEESGGEKDQVADSSSTEEPMRLAKWGCYVRRWKFSKSKGHTQWMEEVKFRGDAALEHTDAAWVLAEKEVEKKWKRGPDRGWEVIELWLEPSWRR